MVWDIHRALAAGMISLLGLGCLVLLVRFSYGTWLYVSFPLFLAGGNTAIRMYWAARNLPA